MMHETYTYELNYCFIRVGNLSYFNPCLSIRMFPYAKVILMQRIQNQCFAIIICKDLVIEPFFFFVCQFAENTSANFFHRCNTYAFNILTMMIVGEMDIWIIQSYFVPYITSSSTKYNSNPSLH